MFRAIGERNLDLISAGVAFWSMLAIFPAVAAIIAFWGFFNDPEILAGQVSAAGDFIPDDAFSLLSGQAQALLEANNSTLGLASLISAGAAVWSTRAGVGALLRGLNAAYATKPRTGIWSTLWALMMTIMLVCVALVAMLSVVVAPVVLEFLPLGGLAEVALRTVRWLLTIGLVLGALGLLYRYGPNHKGRKRPAWVSPGAALAMIIWAAASVGFTTYLTNFGNYNEVYGSIGAVIALLMWFFISAFAVLIGAAANAEIDDYWLGKRKSGVGPAEG